MPMSPGPGMPDIGRPVLFGGMFASKCHDPAIGVVILFDHPVFPRQMIVQGDGGGSLTTGAFNVAAFGDPHAHAVDYFGRALAHALRSGELEYEV